MSILTLSDIIGTAAAVLTTSAFVPQVLHTLRTRDVSGIVRAMSHLRSCAVERTVQRILIFSANMVAYAGLVADAPGPTLRRCLSMYSAFTLGVALWLVYGVIVGSWPIIIANTITASLASVVLFLKLKHGA